MRGLGQAPAARAAALKRSVSRQIWREALNSIGKKTDEQRRGAGRQTGFAFEAYKEAGGGRFDPHRCFARTGSSPPDGQKAWCAVARWLPYILEENWDYIADMGEANGLPQAQRWMRLVARHRMGRYAASLIGPPETDYTRAWTWLGVPAVVKLFDATHPLPEPAQTRRRQRREAEAREQRQAERDAWAGGWLPSQGGGLDLLDTMAPGPATGFSPPGYRPSAQGGAGGSGFLPGGRIVPGGGTPSPGGAAPAVTWGGQPIQPGGMVSPEWIAPGPGPGSYQPPPPPPPPVDEAPPASSKSGAGWVVLGLLGVGAILVLSGKS